MHVSACNLDLIENDFSAFLYNGKFKNSWKTTRIVF